jgi:two-component system NtrC family sensor kinase
MKFATPEEKLKERVKELTCLYEVSKTISQSNCIEKNVLQKIILSTKKAWRFADDAVVELRVQDRNFVTSKIIASGIYQISYINIENTSAGFIRVYYPEEKYTQNSFLEDEQKLLDTIAFEIGNYINKFQKLEKEALLRKSVERADRLSILGEITAGIAHELNTPLGNILGYAELIKDQTNDPEITSDISTIINSVIYSREIVKKLLFFACEMPHQLQENDIKSIVNFATSFLRQNFQKKEVKSNVIFKKDTIIAKVDSVQITQVLFNLLINAIYASPQNSTVTTTVDSDAKNILITIEDEGHGIPENIKHKIFEPFFTTKPLNDGSGLGLSVVHGIVKNHNGEITIKDNYPAGTVFTIKIPLN